MGRTAPFGLGVAATVVLVCAALPSHRLVALDDGPLPSITIEEIRQHLVEYRNAMRSTAGRFSMVASFDEHASPEALASLFSAMWAEWRHDAQGRYFIHCDQLVDGMGAPQAELWLADNGSRTCRISQRPEEPRFVLATLNQDGEQLAMQFRSLALPLEMAGLTFRTAPEFSPIGLLLTQRARLRGQRHVNGAWCYRVVIDPVPFTSPAIEISGEMDLDPMCDFLPRRWAYTLRVERAGDEQSLELISYETTHFDQFQDRRTAQLRWFPTHGARRYLSHVAQVHVEDVQINPVFGHGAFTPPIEQGATVRDARTGAQWVEGGSLGPRQQEFFDRQASEAHAEIARALNNPPGGTTALDASPRTSHWLPILLSAMGVALCAGGLWYYVKRFLSRRS